MALLSEPVNGLFTKAEKVTYTDGINGSVIINGNGGDDTFALDGHSPPSVGGVLGCFGLFEGPKAEAPVYGAVPQKGLKRRYLELSQVAPGE